MSNLLPFQVTIRGLMQEKYPSQNRLSTCR